MTEEIKRIIEDMDLVANYNKVPIYYTQKQIKTLLDYITNLQDDYQEQYTYEYNLRKQFQQENKRLKEKIEEQSLLLIEFQDMEERLGEKDFEIEHWRYKHLKEFKSRKRCEERIDKATSYYLKTLAKNKTIPDEAVEMYNILEGNKL